MFPTMKVNVTSPNLAVLHADWRLHQHFGVGIIAIAPLSGKLLERPYAETKMNDACVIPNKAGSSVRVVGRCVRSVRFFHPTYLGNAASRGLQNYRR